MSKCNKKMEANVYKWCVLCLSKCIEVNAGNILPYMSAIIFHRL